MAAHSRGGAIRHAIHERGHDLYETPPCAVRAPLRTGVVPPVVWEPAAGRGAIVDVLEHEGVQVVASDLVDYGRYPGGIDFLMEQSPPIGVSAILTNPPYKLADQFVRHGLNLVPTVIVLLRLAYLEGSRRSDLIDEHLHRVLLGRERLPMMHRDGWDGPKTNSAMPFAWFVFQQKPSGGQVALERITWRE